MKKLLLLVLLWIFASMAKSQNIDIRKVHANSVNYLMKILNDPGSYSSVKWDSIEKVYDDIEKPNNIAAYDKTIEKILNTQNEMHDIRFNMKLATSRPDTLDKNKKYTDALIAMNRADVLMDSLKKEKEKIKVTYSHILTGYRVQHTFRARNAYNGLILNTYTFTLNKAYKVLSADNNKDIEQELQKMADERSDSLKK
jgi:hypothetical protein